MVSFEAVYSIAQSLSDEDKQRLINALSKDIKPKKKEKKIDPEIEKIILRMQANNAKKLKKLKK